MLACGTGATPTHPISDERPAHTVCGLIGTSANADTLSHQGDKLNVYLVKATNIRRSTEAQCGLASKHHRPKARSCCCAAQGPHQRAKATDTLSDERPAHTVCRLIGTSANPDTLSHQGDKLNVYLVKATNNRRSTEAQCGLASKHHRPKARSCCCAAQGPHQRAKATDTLSDERPAHTVCRLIGTSANPDTLSHQGDKLNVYLVKATNNRRSTEAQCGSSERARTRMRSPTRGIN